MPHHRGMCGASQNEDRGHRVLVVDDDPDVRDSLVVLLATLGFQPHPAGNGEQALDALPHVRPRIVLMDLNMPVMDGFEAARRARGMPDAQGVPIVAYSAQAGQRIEERIREAGFSARLTKPADLEELLATFASVGVALPGRGE